MPTATPSVVRKQIAAGTLDPIYLIVGDDEAEMSHLAADISGIVEDELRAFNVERIYATDKSSVALSIAEAARQLPMMAARRVVVVLRAEKLLKPRRKGKAAEDAPGGEEAAGPAPDVDALEAYVKKPEAQTVLVFVAADVDRSR
jgi:DNA polymerase-3 subunit delta